MVSFDPAIRSILGRSHRFHSEERISMPAAHAPLSEQDRRDSATAGVRAASAAFGAYASTAADQPESLHHAIVAMHHVCGALAHAIAEGVPAKELHELASPARETAALSPFVRRLQEWPRGYQGDFETIEYIMQQKVMAAIGTPGYWIELHSLTSGIVQQHRNKVAAQALRIIQEASRDSPTRILVLAAGSSPDLAIAAPVLRNCDVSITVVDSDPDAIAFSRERLSMLKDKVHFVSANVLNAIASLEPRAPFDLVLAGGLMDYLPPRHACGLVRSVASQLLAPGGSFFFTNMIHPNPYRGWMRHVANWRIFERSAQEIEEIVRTACGNSVDVETGTDGTGLALLVECRRTDRRHAAVNHESPVGT